MTRHFDDTLVRLAPQMTPHAAIIDKYMIRRFLPMPACQRRVSKEISPSRYFATPAQRITIYSRIDFSSRRDGHAIDGDVRLFHGRRFFDRVLASALNGRRPRS